MPEEGPDVLAREITGVINGYVETSPWGYCHQFGGRFFEEPLVGFTRGDDQIFDTVREEAAARRETYGISKTGCGLCQVGVPCEDRIPRVQD